MKRVHLFELEDQPWFPAIMRDAGTGYLSRMVEAGRMVDPTIEPLRRALAKAKQARIVDLCSGAGAPARLVAAALPEVQVVCTDLYPNRDALAHQVTKSAGNLQVHPEPVDATAVPRELDGVRTLYNGFHHFRPELARAILQDAVRSRQPIAVFEFVGRRLDMVLGMLFVPLAVLALLPTIRPFRWGWVPLTYLVPLIPLFVQWDGIVSCLRVYSLDELRELTRGLDELEWDCGHFELKGPGRGTYLVGVPKARSESVS